MAQTARDHTGLRLFSKLLGIPAPSGHEDRMVAFLDAELKRLGYEPEVDPAGNVLVRLEGRSSDRPVCCIAAHMDEIGLVVTAIAPNGALHVDRLGGTLPWKLGETAVQILGDHESILGVSSTGSGHSRAQASECPGWEGVRVLTGLPAERLAEKGFGSARRSSRRMRSGARCCSAIRWHRGLPRGRSTIGCRSRAYSRPSRP
jgi:putative aminopeptidase FrvX